MPISSGSYPPRAVPPALQGLVKLALDLRWSWHHGSDVLWRTLGEETWERVPNAWLVLNSVSDRRLKQLAEDPDFLGLLDRQLEAQAEFNRVPTWFSTDYQGCPFKAVAFFSMEYGVTESLPIYSGGLGILAGDLLKASSDLGVPVIAVGLLYQQGYFRQSVNSDGDQLEFYPYNDPTMLPLSPLRDEHGEWVRVVLDFPGRRLSLRAWHGQVGRCELLLLDSNDPINEPGDRGITSELYGGGSELRLQQELVLGIGGWRLLQQLGIQPEVCHLNEGHTAFAALERVRSIQLETGLAFDAARLAARARTLFTTHTPVAAGFDRFPVELVERYLAPLAAELGIAMHELLALGQGDGADPDAPFNMAYLAMSLAGAANGVSEVHGRVSRQLMQHLYPRWPTSEVPIASVTNGVHTPSWDSPAADALWTRAYGKNRWRGDLAAVDAALPGIDDGELWALRNDNRRRLVAFLRRRLTLQHCEKGGADSAGAACGLDLDDEALIIGFARRFTEYKRPNLLLQDPERLVRILNDRSRPVQLVIAGKAHPRDQVGKDMLKQWIRFITRPDVIGRVVFIEDYDLQVAAAFVQGVDVWLNTPRSPWEACGTSGMKVLVNGGLNLSQRDGWWAEAHDPAVGWSIGSPEGLPPGRIAEGDRADAEELYRRLENEVVPSFYDTDAQGIPRAWVALMRESMSRLTPQFSANRMVREYTERFYGPLASGGARRTPEVARQLAAVVHGLRENWHRLRFGSVLVEHEAEHHHFHIQLHVDGLDPDWLKVELVSENDGVVRCEPLTRGEPLVGSEHAFNYHGAVPADRPSEHYTPRVVPAGESLHGPLELNLILWHH
ncbi:alpha-glucan family phosphorylase [Hydrocarboniclastica marina]|uniref:alpha-glucan family phosphorylase n=1 Tax=Hydrocarboniclastica marina TaxID=2259620 RepID=UPI0015626152|nr:alpha-glucan family phosphorylase [Hydrocarboniclastica marina]